MILSCCILYQLNISAQTAFSVSSGSASIGTTSIDWTFGEMCAIETSYSPNFIITQGFHQPFMKMSGVDVSAFAEGAIKIFPNPTIQSIYIEYFADQPDQWEIALFQSDDKLVHTFVWQLSVGENQHRFSMDTFKHGCVLSQMPFGRKKQNAELQNNQAK